MLLSGAEMKLYRFGKPVETGAVLEKPLKFLQNEEIATFKLNRQKIP